MRRIFTLLPLLLAACTPHAQEPPICKLFEEAIHEHAAALSRLKHGGEGSWAEVIATLKAAERVNAARALSTQVCGCIHWEITEAAWDIRRTGHVEAHVSSDLFNEVVRSRAARADEECTELGDSTGYELDDSTG